MGRTRKEDYEALSTSEEATDSGPYPRPLFFFPLKSPAAILITLLSLSNLLFINLWLQARGGPAYPNAQILYTPAKDILAYEPVMFYTGDISNVEPDIYSRPPSKEVDEAWEGLYNDIGILAIDETIAEQLPNRTAVIPGSEEGGEKKYRISLSIFHQLHCLNKIRQAFHPDRYPASAANTGHITHCINTLRQSLQCASDVSPIVYHEKTTESNSNTSSASKLEPRFDIVHSCRNFGKIQEWAKAHREP